MSLFFFVFLFFSFFVVFFVFSRSFIQRFLNLCLKYSCQENTALSLRSHLNPLTALTVCRRGGLRLRFIVRMHGSLGGGRGFRHLSARLLRLALDLSKDTGAGDSHTKPARKGHLVALEEDREEDAEDLAGRRHRRAHQRVERRDGVEDERLPDRRAEAELRNQRQDLRVLEEEAGARKHFAVQQGKDHRDTEHVEVRPEHEVVRLHLDALLRRLRLQALLHTAREPVAHQRAAEEEQAREGRAATTLLAAAHRHNSRAGHDGGHLHVLPHRVRRTAEEQRADHDRHHLARLGQRRDGEGHARGQRGVGAVLRGHLREAGHREHVVRDVAREAGVGEEREADQDVGGSLKHLQPPDVLEGLPGLRLVPEHILLEASVVQEAGVDATRSPEQLRERALLLHELLLPFSHDSNRRVPSFCQ
eukprot:Rhum_TRINITY_DN14364_c8_g2::Rhum_TRINITY_DN14364_c8_g2_i1::g.85492::m.85492